MSGKDDFLNNIFEKAKTQPPEVSFEEVSKRFGKSLSAKAGDLSSINFKTMFSNNFHLFVIGILAISIGLFFISQPEPLKEMTTNLSEIHTEIKKDSKPEILSETTIIQPEKKESPKEPVIQKLNPVPMSETVTEIRNETIALPKSETLIDAVFDNSKMPILNKQSEKLNMPNYDTVILSQPKTEFKNVKHPSDCKEVRFTVTEKTKPSEFDKMAALARKAGIKFWSQVHDQKPTRKSEIFLIRDMQIKMNIPDTEFDTYIKVEVPKYGKFEFDFGWCENEKGEAVSLTDNINISIPDPKKKRKRNR